MNTQNSFLALNSVFPRLSETFVYQQYATWTEQGTPYHIISSNRPGAEEVHPNMTDLMSKTDYICDTPKKEALGLLLHFAIKHPVKLLRGLANILRLEERPSTSLAHMLGAVYIHKHYAQSNSCTHSHFTYGATAIAWWLQSLFGIPYVVTLHGSDVFFDDVKDLKRKLENATHLICISEFNKSFILEKYDVDENNASVIGMGVDPVSSSDIIQQTQELSSTNTVKLLNVGRLSEQKAHTLLLQACERLTQQGYKIECTIVGDGELKEQLSSEIRRRGLENTVQLAGAKYHEEVLSMYQHFDLFVMSSVAEGMPIVLMEAMGRGLPVVGPDISGIPELFDHGNAGALFKTGDLDDMCRAIKECIDNTADSEAKRVFATQFISDRFNSTTNATLVAKLLTQTSQRNNITL